MNKGKKVFLGMSGGVDSSVSAALLLEQGYDVTGVFIKVWQPDFIECTWKEDRLDAMRVASQLGIPFVTLDLEKEYKEGVIDYMIEEYRAGRTPNPDVMCNREVKFGAFWKWAEEQGADYIATGHYAVTDNALLVVSKDANKDQTYFLWTLTKNDLEHVLFPIGEMIKDDVRKEAQKRNLYTSTKKDSQGLCFVGSIDLKTLLKEYIKEEKGEVVNEEGVIIGTHDGAMFYTIGERHGFTITEKSTDDAAYYVISKDLEKNLVVVSHEKPTSDLHRSISLEKESFVGAMPEEGKTYEARGRYRAPLAKVRLHQKNGDWSVEILEGELVYTSGQSIVIYSDNLCLGGGIMK
jgi:tRNA-specific 2-thiouridylase